MTSKFLNSSFATHNDDNRWHYFSTTPVFIGSTPLGGDYPIRLQSMTNTDTFDTNSSVLQCIRIIEAGADYVRLTAQGRREAENLANIKKKLHKAGFFTPLIADIHFNPAAAETAARIVEKVRINPGNYSDRRASFIKNELTEKQYNEELERIHERLLPLIRICRQNKTAIRIGINHGSLSDRIMTRYGNTPAGMVRSAMEFIEIFRAENFNDLVLSMKSSDPGVMIEANRMLVRFMQDEGMTYPVHLGVTEAGEGEDGRIRSAAGIGTLLSEGIGDTIRVSLSEPPENEIPVAKKLAGFFPKRIAAENPAGKLSFRTPPHKPAIISRIRGPLVVADLTSRSFIDDNSFAEAGYNIDKTTGEVTGTDNSADILITNRLPGEMPRDGFIVLPFNEWIKNRNAGRCYPLFSSESYSESREKSDDLNLVFSGPDYNIELIKKIDTAKSLLLFQFDAEEERYAADIFLNELDEHNLAFNIILNPVFSESDPENIQIKAAALLGRYITDRNIAGICITNKKGTGIKESVSLCFSILQSTEARITRTIYISCPTCGRTKFDLQDAVKKVKSLTAHLKGLKIAVMGCIVNGPGEMAGADYGYVGASEGKVHIYKGTEPVLKNVPQEYAAEELLKVIEDDQTSL